MLPAKIVNIEQERAEVQLPDGQKLRLPLTAFEGQIRVGSEIVMLLAVPGSEDIARQKLAKDSVNEIISE